MKISIHTKQLYESGAEREHRVHGPALPLYLMCILLPCAPLIGIVAAILPQTLLVLGFDGLAIVALIWAKGRVRLLQRQ